MYKWDIKSIKERISYVKERLTRTYDQNELNKLNVTLLSYLFMLDNSGTLKYTRYTNIMDKINHDNYAIKRRNEAKRIENKILIDNIGEMTNDYLSFLLELTKNTIKDINDDDEYIEFQTKEYSNEELINISRNFYSNLEDPDIDIKATKVFGKEENINFTTTFRQTEKDYNGLNYNDYIFKESFVTIRKENTIMDILSTNHELGHAINFSFNYDKLFENTYGGFNEVPTYTFDYLMLDYMEELGLPTEEIDKLRIRKEESLTNLANYTLTSIRSRILSEKGLAKYNNYTVDDVSNGLRMMERRNLLEVESFYIAKGLYQQIKDNKKDGIENLKLFMKTPIDRTKKPDFTFIGLSDEKIMSLSEEKNLKKIK